MQSGEPFAWPELGVHKFNRPTRSHRGRRPSKCNNSWRDHACQIRGPKGREKSAFDHLLSIDHGRPLDRDDLAIMAGDPPGSPLTRGRRMAGPRSLASESPGGLRHIETRPVRSVPLPLAGDVSCRSSTWPAPRFEPWDRLPCLKAGTSNTGRFRFQPMHTISCGIGNALDWARGATHVWREV